MLLVIFQEAVISMKEQNESLSAELEQERLKILELVEKLKAYKLKEVNDSFTIHVHIILILWIL
jgi:hypothetical protein